MVYVDNPLYRFGHMQMCHMVADTTEELLEMADRIGVQRKWIQDSGTYKEHFDICKSKRKLAVKLGAQEIDSYTLGRFLKGRRQCQQTTTQNSPTS